MSVGVRVGVVVAVFAASVAAGSAAGAAQSWSVVPTATGASYGALAAVSCPATASCFAVGVLDAPGAHTRLIERWDGTKWSAVSSPNPPGATTSQLPPAVAQQVYDLARQADQHYTAAQAALRAGDWATYGKEQQAMEDAVKKLVEITGPLAK